MNMQPSIGLSKASSAQDFIISKSGSSKTLDKQKKVPMIQIELAQYEFYEGEVINGLAKISFDKSLKDYDIRIALIYEEHYILFNEKTEQAILSKKHKKALLNQRLEAKEKQHPPGQHSFQFGIQLPEHMKGATFYHSGKSVIAKITYKLQIKVLEKSKLVLQAQEEEDSDDDGSFKESTFIKINYHHKYVTIHKQLYDEGVIQKFLCFGGGITSLAAEYQRDTFCIETEFVLGNSEEEQNGSSIIYNSNHLYENKQNLIEVKYTVNNMKNQLKVDEVLVQLVQVIAIKEDDNFNKADRKKVVKHVQEILYNQIQPGILPKDETDQP